MQVHNIQSVNFEKKQKFITPKAKKNIETLLNKMNEEGLYDKNEYYFQSTLTKGLKYKDNFELIDGRLNVGKIKQKDQMKKETHVFFDNIKLIIDNATGEVKDYKKPFFTRWKKIMQTLDEYLIKMNDNYENADIVKKKRISVAGFTQKGFEKIQSAGKQQ